MLISALENTSSSVIIDLETHNDLEKMRNKPVLGNTNTIYLILTYLSEFDKVYYPLPLQLKVEDNHLIGHFQKEIFELNNNLNLIIKEKEDLFEENNKLKSEFLLMNRLVEKENTEKEKIRKEFESLENNTGKEIKYLKSIVEDLQNKLKTEGVDKTDEFTSLQQENTRIVLENKILAAEVRKLRNISKKKDERIEELQKIVEEHKELGKERSKSVYCNEEKTVLKVSNASTRSRSTVKYVSTTDISAKLEKIVNLLAFNEKN